MTARGPAWRVAFGLAYGRALTAFGLGIQAPGIRLAGAVAVRPLGALADARARPPRTGSLADPPEPARLPPAKRRR